MSDTRTMTIRDVDANDIDIFQAAAAEQGLSLIAYVRRVLRDQARCEHNRALLDAIDAAEEVPALADLDAATEVREMRDEQDTRDTERAERA